MGFGYTPDSQLPGNRDYCIMWQDWVNGILGLWVILIPFVGADSVTVLVITGIVIAVLGFWAASAGKKPMGGGM